MNSMRKGELDGLACAVGTDERKEYLSFSPPYFSIPTAIIVREETRDIGDIRDLFGKTVSINKGSYMHEWLENRYPEIILHTKSNDKSVQAVSHGKADAYIGNLAVANHIISERLLNGSITVKSKEGEGSVFTVSFIDIPVTEHDEVPDLFRRECDSIIFDAADILVVDDFQDNRILVTDNFKNTNLIFHEASNGRKAIEILLDRKIDLVFLDLRMPVMNGYETIAIIKNNDDLKDIPIIALTASIMERDMEKVDQYGFDGHVRKPASHNDLFKAVAQFLPYTKEEEIIEDNEIVSMQLPPEKIEELLVLVESRFKPEWDNIKDKGDFSLINNFAAALKEEAMKLGIKSIENYANMLIAYTDSFEIIEVDKLMNQFPEITGKLQRRRRGEK